MIYDISLNLEARFLSFGNTLVQTVLQLLLNTLLQKMLKTNEVQSGSADRLRVYSKRTGEAALCSSFSIQCSHVLAREGGNGDA